MKALKKHWKSAGVMAGAAATVLMVAGPASATAVVGAEVPGARGEMAVDWVSNKTANPIDLKVTDTEADGRVAKMRVVASTGSGQKAYAWRTASGQWANTKAVTHLTDSSTIYWLRIEVCRVSNAGPEQCSLSGKISNPYA
ncbi:hypothetical protein [Streptomyces sp. NPDC048603]|uniref:hypothetical protein n=1 Tax=Streptomyces sp. NPDC048603 TaxID=3365577 RepID=UPI00371B3188